VAALSKAWVCGCVLATIAVSSPSVGMAGCLSLVKVVRSQVEVFATSQSLIQKSPTECGVSSCV
jgi:competence protein ComGC